jgi:hypothetical protein
MKAFTVCSVCDQFVVEYTLNFVGIAGPYTNFSAQGDYSYSTSFPQPILMGAAFDDALITKVATVISTEARAFNNANRFVSCTKTHRTPTDPEKNWARLLDPEYQSFQRSKMGSRSRNPWRGPISSLFIRPRLDPGPPRRCKRSIQASRCNMQTLRGL